MTFREIVGTKAPNAAPYFYDAALDAQLSVLAQRLADLQQNGTLTADRLRVLSRFFRLKNIYHSNAIEGNTLTPGETRLVVEEGLTITGKPLKDTLEAKNLAHALDLFENLSATSGDPLSAYHILSLHAAILAGIDDANAGKYRDVGIQITGSRHRQPDPVAVPSKMAELSDWLQKISVAPNSYEPVITACVAHSWFVCIHPFIDGNGRTARLLMNLLLLRAGYPLAIIRQENRLHYYDTLEQSQDGDLTALLTLVIGCIMETLNEFEAALKESRIEQGWQP
jgi:Fic family protein